MRVRSNFNEYQMKFLVSLANTANITVAQAQRIFFQRGFAHTDKKELEFLEEHFKKLSKDEIEKIISKK